MCEFISFKIEQGKDGLKIVTAPSLSDHSDIPGNGYEGEWREDGIEVRVPDDVSDHVKKELETFVKKTYRTRKNMADKLIVEYLEKGEMPGHFFEHSKLNERSIILFACDCAEHVLPIFEKKYPNDKRPRETIEVSRKFTRGKATKKELDAAADAAAAAAWDAAAAAAWDAAAAAAWDAARDAGWDAAWDAARAAALAAAAARAATRDARAAAASAARDAAWDAAGDAARAATRDARAATRDARAAAWDTEEKWQAAKLLEYIHV